MGSPSSPRNWSLVSGVSDRCLDPGDDFLSALPRPPWRKWKAAYVAHLEDADPSAVRVSLADKVHKVRTIVLDYRQLGQSLWERFDPGADPVWYYRSLADVFARRSSSPLTAELQREVSELEALTGSPREQE
jgi:hypothetical protein